MTAFSSRKPKLPEPFVERIYRQFAGEYPEFLQALEMSPHTSIRLHPHKWAFRGDADDPLLPAPFQEPVPWSQNGLFLQERPSFTMDPLFHAGGYYVQEASSMFLEYVLNLPELRSQSQLVLDACASPGGKTTLIAAQYPESLVIANEVIRSRLAALLENSIKWGTGNIVITQNDTAQFSSLSQFFDLVVADAPCSGEGLFRKNPAARQEWTPDSARHCAMRQRSILKNLWNAIKPGGYLIYTTCTFNPDENEHNVAWLLELTGGQCIRIPIPSGDSAIHEISGGAVTGYGFYPHRVSGEGFFLTLIRKPPASDDFHPYRPRVRAKPILDPDKKMAAKASGWFINQDYSWFQIRDRLHRIRSTHLDLLHLLASTLSVRYAGTETATIIRDQLRPSAAAALDIHIDLNHFPNIPCSKEQALAFLRRESLPVPEEAAKGWHLATYQGLPLGWLKNIGNRMNNYHPKEWRIKK